MSTDQAESAVSLSAFLVAAIFGYRKLVEAAQSPTAGVAAVPSTGHFVIGFGFTFVLLSILAQAAPAFGGMMAVLVGTGDLLVNGQPIANDISSSLKSTQPAIAARATPGAPTPFDQATAGPGRQNTPGL